MVWPALTMVDFDSFWAGLPSCICFMFMSSLRHVFSVVISSWWLSCSVVLQYAVYRVDFSQGWPGDILIPEQVLQILLMQYWLVHDSEQFDLVWLFGQRFDPVKLHSRGSWLQVAGLGMTCFLLLMWSVWFPVSFGAFKALFTFLGIN